jgi:hypothetical protein
MKYVVKETEVEAGSETYKMNWWLSVQLLCTVSKTDTPKGHSRLPCFS